MLPRSVSPAARRFLGAVSRFRDDESGNMAVFVMVVFMLMITLGGISIDVMRFETRRVAMQQTMDRAALAAANLEQTRTPAEIAEDWFDKVNLNSGLDMVTFSDVTVDAISNDSLRRVTLNSNVVSDNFFMRLLNVDQLQTPTLSEAAQGRSDVEIFLVLDITGSMTSTVGDTDVTKMEALVEAGQEFVDIVEENDTQNGTSIGMVPYTSQVNIPEELRQQFNVTDVSSWDGVANAGVPDINCIEIPEDTYGSAGLSTDLEMPMMAVADAKSSTSTTIKWLNPKNYTPATGMGTRPCSMEEDDSSTDYNENLMNLLVMPTKDTDDLKTAISRLTADGNTGIAVGMRWATALLDEAAQPIYEAIGDDTVQDRPADNDDSDTRKIIVLMTDGSHVTNYHIKDGYKSGPSPIYRGSDGYLAIRFWEDGPNFNNNTRPSCATNKDTTTVKYEYFVPHLKTSTKSSACSAAAWLAAPEWTTTYTKSGKTVTEAVTVTQLDWSEVWRYMRLSYVVRQLYMRSNVTDTSDYDTLMAEFRQSYLTSASNMDTLLQENCSAARLAGIEIYGIAFEAGTSGEKQINGCASTPKASYYFDVEDNADLMAAFSQIATDVSELRLTQ